MATMINITPVLKGKESVKFNATISNSKSNKISDAKKAKMFGLVTKILSKDKNLD